MEKEITWIIDYSLRRLKTECYFGKRLKQVNIYKQTIYDHIHDYNNECIKLGAILDND